MSVSMTDKNIACSVWMWRRIYLSTDSRLHDRQGPGSNYGIVVVTRQVYLKTDSRLYDRQGPGSNYGIVVVTRQVYLTTDNSRPSSFRDNRPSVFLSNTLIAASLLLTYLLTYIPTYLHYLQHGTAASL